MVLSSFSKRTEINLLSMLSYAKMIPWEKNKRLNSPIHFYKKVFNLMTFYSGVEKMQKKKISGIPGLRGQIPEKNFGHVLEFQDKMR